MFCPPSKITNCLELMPEEKSMESETTVWLIESPVVMVEGEQIAYSVDWQGAAGDEHVITGSVLTLKKLRARSGDGAARYVLVVEAEVDGNLERRKLLIHIARASAES